MFFLPGCKAAQLWTILQGEVECSLQGAQPLCGLSTDLIRAFNNIPRQHTFALAQHLGVPSKVLQPWRLDRVHVPLGCRALWAMPQLQLAVCRREMHWVFIVYAMIQLNFSWHITWGPFVLRCEHLASLTTRPLLPTCQTCWQWDLLAWWNSFACGTSKLRLRSLTAGPFIKITGINSLRFHSNVLPRRTNLRASCHLANVAVQASSRSASKHLNHAGKHWSVPGRHCDKSWLPSRPFFGHQHFMRSMVTVLLITLTSCDREPP